MTDPEHPETDQELVRFWPAHADDDVAHYQPHDHGDPGIYNSPPPFTSTDIRYGWAPTISVHHDTCHYRNEYQQSNEHAVLLLRPFLCNYNNCIIKSQVKGPTSFFCRRPCREVLPLFPVLHTFQGLGERPYETIGLRKNHEVSFFGDFNTGLELAGEQTVRC